MYQAIIVDDEKWVVKSLTATLDAMQVMEQFHIVAELCRCSPPWYEWT